MKIQTSLKSASGILAIAVATLAPIGSAQALDILGNKFMDPVAGATTPMVDRTGYGKLDILGNTYWIQAAHGAQGPVRTETMDAASYRKLDILGNVFWLPKSE